MTAKNVTQALTAAAERMLKPLVRVLLRNGIPYRAFADIARQVYVEVAEKEFALPGRAQTVSRISTITGLTRKEVTRTQARETPDEGEGSWTQNRAARVIGGWVRDKAYNDRKGSPADLPMEGEKGSFAALVRGFSGDIPARTIAEELARVGAIELLPDGKARLLTRAYIPRGDQAEKIAILGMEVADLIRTIDHNLTSPSGEAYFQRRVSYNNIPRELLPGLTKKLSRKAQACLESLDRELAAADRDSSAAKGSGRVRTGIGIYYFEENVE
jgi:hypothetical protein